jgi:hypothetical protein
MADRILSGVVPGFKAVSFWLALGFVMVLWIIKSFLSRLQRES